MENLQLIRSMDDQLSSVPQANKATRTALASSILNDVLNGDRDPLEVLQSIRVWEDVFKNISKDEAFADATLTELQKHGKSTVLNGHTLQQSESGVTYDFEGTGDPVYRQLLADLEAAKQRVKEREATLKSLTAKGLEILDEGTGELVRIYPPAKNSKTIVKVTLK